MTALEAILGAERASRVRKALGCMPSHMVYPRPWSQWKDPLPTDVGVKCFETKHLTQQDLDAIAKVPQGTDQWLRNRNSTLGASEMPAVAGHDPYNPLGKKLIYDSSQDCEGSIMNYNSWAGHHAESAFISIMEAVAGPCKWAEAGTLRDGYLIPALHRGADIVPCRTASVDATPVHVQGATGERLYLNPLTAGDRQVPPLEFKNRSSYVPTNVTAAVLIQVQQQMLVTMAPYVDALFCWHDNPSTRTYPPTPRSDRPAYKNKNAEVTRAFMEDGGVMFVSILRIYRNKALQTAMTRRLKAYVKKQQRVARKFAAGAISGPVQMAKWMERRDMEGMDPDIREVIGWEPLRGSVTILPLLGLACFGKKMDTVDGSPLFTMEHVVPVDCRKMPKVEVPLGEPYYFMEVPRNPL